MGFPVPKFSPYISKVTFDVETMDVVVEKTCYFKGTEGTPVSGISSTSADSMPFSKDCKSELEYDPSGLDSEDVFPIAGTGLCLAVDEYSPSIFVVNCDFDDDEACGTIVMRYTPQGVTLDGATYPVKDTLPKIYTERRNGRGFESIAVSPEGSTAFVFVQSPMGSNEVDSPYRNSFVIRVLELDISDPLDIQVVGEYLYPADAPETWTVEENIPTDVKLSAALWLGDEDSDDILVLERAKGQVKLYVANFGNATNVFDMEESSSLYWEDMSNKWMLNRFYFTITKTLLLDSAQVTGWDLDTISDKQGGVGIVNDCTVVMGADNEFGLSGSGPSSAIIVQMQQCISTILANNDDDDLLA
eukprot:TRINITY_DN9542_c0_g1_i3.p2 TRINITY_DN9542_c0_g1~~TRINITY_DN9542_c0_g1_i3.p2  ORF type:complete len:359 (+),score=75.54 TRINITY_DN9542_c0_g1_i3:739-1815(+)